VTQDRETSGDEAVDVGRGSDNRGVAGWREDEADEVSFLEIANVVLKRWKLIVGTPLVAALLMALISFVLPSQYTAVTTFVPEVSNEEFGLPSGLAGLASQFGVAVPAAANSPQFYADVLESRTVNDAVMLARFPDPRADTPGDSAILLDLLDVEGEGERERLEEGRKKLDKSISVEVDNETNIVSLGVKSRYPELSADVANLFIDLLNHFNLETRQSNARARRHFIEARMVEVEKELRISEDDLQRFLEGNRQFRGSPDLAFQYERLQRQVAMKQEVVTTLRRQYEEARIQEVDDTPVITVVDRAVAPDRRSSPRRTLNVIVAFFLGGVIGVTVAFTREFADRARVREEKEFRELQSRWAGIRADLASFFSRSG
jgi:tyrosine-protein kinase Etk/Wzc